MLDSIEQFEVGIKVEAADIEFSLVGLDNCGGEEKHWRLIINDTSPIVEKEKCKTLMLDHNQASAIIALFVGEFSDEKLNQAIYDIAEEAVKDLPINLRPIP